MRQNLSTLKTNLAGLLTQGRDITPAQLVEIMTDMVDSLEEVIRLSTVTSLTGLAAVETSAMSKGSLVCLKVSGITLSYELCSTKDDEDLPWESSDSGSDGDPFIAALSPYIILPDDFDFVANPKYWRMMNTKFYQIKNTDLDGSHKMAIAHDLPADFIVAKMFDNSGNHMSESGSAAPGTGQVKLTITKPGELGIEFSGAITGTYHLLIKV